MGERLKERIGTEGGSGGEGMTGEERRRDGRPRVKGRTVGG